MQVPNPSHLEAKRGRGVGLTPLPYLGDMYIGAWTEYRLGLEKQQQQQAKGQDVAQQWQRSTTAQYDDHHAIHSAAPFGRTGAAVGIYHPSLSDKGGEGVAQLPNRESFRKTLESALSSNLAADDAEHITQALEPLLQRLPTIRSPAATGRTTRARTLCRRSRRENRHGSRRIDRSTRSEGSRSARLAPSSDGTGSARSSFSSASAPLSTTAGLRFIPKSSRTAYGKARRTIKTVTQFPRIDRARDALRTITVNGMHPARPRQCPGSGAVVAGEVPPRNENNSSSRSLRDDIRQRASLKTAKEATVAAAPGIPEKERCSPEACDGGFDGGKAATLLRLARSRDPAGIKADFQQFWSWKTSAHQPERNAAMTASSAGGRGGQDTRFQHNDRHVSTAASVGATRSTAKRAAGGDGGGTLSKLETLARMKDVYMAKATVDNSANGQYHDGEGTQEGGGEGGGQTRVGFSSPEDPVVVVPDLELTESRIRLVDKYFGGGGGRQWKLCQDEGYQPEAACMWNPPPLENDVARRPPASDDCTVTATGVGSSRDNVNTGANNVGGDRREQSNWTLPTYTADRQRMAAADGFMENPLVTPVSIQENLDATVRLEETSGKNNSSDSSSNSSTADVWLNTHPSGLGNLEENDAVHLDPTNERLLKNEIATLHTEIPENGERSTCSILGDGDVVPTLACCGDTLEDLVCWTKQLDFDAAVKGY